MDRFHKMLRSRTFWVFVLMFVVNGLEGIRDSIPKEYLPFINALLVGAGIYFRVYPNQQFETRPNSPAMPLPPPPAGLTSGGPYPRQFTTPSVPPSFSIQPPFFGGAGVFPTEPPPFSQPQPPSFIPPSFEPPVSGVPVNEKGSL